MFLLPVQSWLMEWQVGHKTQSIQISSCDWRDDIYREVTHQTITVQLLLLLHQIAAVQMIRLSLRLLIECWPSSLYVVQWLNIPTLSVICCLRPQCDSSSRLRVLQPLTTKALSSFETFGTANHRRITSYQVHCNCMKQSMPLGKLTVAQLLKKFSIFYGNWRFIIVLAIVRLWSLTGARLIQSTCEIRTYTHIHHNNLKGCFKSGSENHIFYHLPLLEETVKPHECVSAPSLQPIRSVPAVSDHQTAESRSSIQWCLSPC